MRTCAYLWPFTFGVRLGWLTAGHPQPAAPSADRVFFLRGNAVVFSGGFGVLCHHLRRAGHWAEDLRCVGHRWACRELLSQREHGRVVLVGHSAGARYALHAAQDLVEHGITIDLLVTIDVTC